MRVPTPRNRWILVFSNKSERIGKLEPIWETMKSTGHMAILQDNFFYLVRGKYNLVSLK